MSEEEVRVDFQKNKEKYREEFNANAYYVIIVIASLLALLFLPMLGTQVGLEVSLPTTKIGWIVYIVIKLIVAGLNVLIFHSFVKQAKINIKDDVHYKEARELLNSNKVKKYIPKSPKKFFGKLYGSKGTSIFFSTLISVIALGQALLNFDFISFLSYLFTIIMGIIFGIMTMFKVEDYWTNEYLDFAKYTNNKLKGENNDNN